jgi:hypothetical protein
MPVEHALTHEREVGAAVLAERDQLAVEHRPHRQVGEEGGLLAHVPAAAATHPQRSLGRDDRAETAPLHLEATRPVGRRLERASIGSGNALYGIC